MRGTYLQIVFLAAALLAITSCSTTRYVPDGQYRLRKNIIIADEDVPKNERITRDELERYVRQSANRKFLGTNFYLWTYNASDTTKNNWWNKTLRRIGDEPVVLDTSLTIRSAENIQTYMRSRGYFDARSEFEIETKKKTATVTYRVTQGEPYTIGNISYDFQDEFLRPVVMRDSAQTLLRAGDNFDLNILNAERSRITQNLKNSGYFDFNVNNISYIADSTMGHRRVDVTLVVRQYLSGYDSRGNPIYENNTVYRIRDIYINPDYDPVAAATDPSYYSNMDTMSYRGLNILYSGRPNVRPRVLRQAIKLYPNYLYSTDEINRAYSDIMRLGYYRSAAIVFENVSDSTEKNVVTFIGSEDELSTLQTTTEGYLSCNINCIPALKQSYKIDLEGSASSNFYGLGATVGYQNRNLFRGVELFDVSATGRYEFVRSKGKKGSFEIGGATSMSFPRFITPFRVDPFNKVLNPKTRVELSVNAQRRPYYHRTLSGLKLGYSWNNKKNGTFTLRPLDLNLVKISYIDDDFLQSLENPYLIDSYSPQLVGGISGSYVYNNQLSAFNTTSNSLIFRFNWETMGNLFYGLTNLFANKHYDSDAGENYYRIFGIRYAQYFRLDASISKRVMTGAKASVAYRFLVGGGLSYGNSKSIPSDRLFYSGGSNSMRGWIARTLGPGGIISPTSSKYNSQLGNFKLEANIETRFPVWGFLHGAVFLDAGNIWLLQKGNYDDASVFRFDTFAKQFGLNTGVGARLDFGFFIIRLDWGIKLHDPNQLRGERWITNFKPSDTVLNFGVGYPF